MSIKEQVATQANLINDILDLNKQNNHQLQKFFSSWPIFRTWYYLITTMHRLKEINFLDFWKFRLKFFMSFFNFQTHTISVSL